MNPRWFHPRRPDLIDGFCVRPAQPQDLDALLVVEHASQPAPWSDIVFLREFDLDWSVAWVVEPESGASLMAFLVFWVVRDEIHILNIAVHPSYRRRGVAQALLDELVDLARERQIAIISLEVRVGNEAAKSLYGSMGFRQIGRRPNYYADNQEDADVLALVLEDAGSTSETRDA